MRDLKRAFPYVDFLIGLVVQVVLWLLSSLIINIDWSGALFVLLIFTGMIFIVPLIITGKIDDEYDTFGMLTPHAAVQGVFTVFPFFALEDWSFMTPLIVLCLLGTGIAYFVAVLYLNLDFPASLPESKRRLYIIMQGVFGFAVGTVVALILAVVYALLSGKRKK